MSRTLKTDMPGDDWRVSRERLAPGALENLYAPDLEPPLRLVVDIGFGRGEFLLQLAEEDPATAFLGLERSGKRVLKMARRLARSGLRNVRLVEGPAEEAVALLPKASVAVFWVNFPDPWPKKRHQRRRLLSPAFVAALVERLEPGGLLRVATDHVGYAAAIHEVLAASSGLENLNAPAPHVPSVDDRPRTAYELEWLAEGRDFHFFSYRRR